VVGYCEVGGGGGGGGGGVSKTTSWKKRFGDNIDMKLGKIVCKGVKWL